MSSNQPKGKALSDLLGELDAGNFENRVAMAFKEVALGVVTNGKKGSVVLTFDFDQIGDSDQVQCKHKVSFVKPTARGKTSEDYTNKTPLHVHRDGNLSTFPYQSGDLLAAVSQRDNA